MLNYYVYSEIFFEGISLVIAGVLLSGDDIDFLEDIKIGEEFEMVF